MKIKIPNTLVLLFSIILFVAILTWIVPGGEYSRMELKGREVIDPGSYRSTEHIPQGIGAILQAPLRGFIAASDIIAFVLIVGGAFAVIQGSGAIDALIKKIARAHQDSKFLQWAIIPLTMIIFSTFGAVFGMSEEVIPFVLIFIPLAVSLGYDTIVGVAIPFVGAGAGFAGAIINPFTVGIAQGIAELPLSSGIGYRLICWFIITSIAIIFVMIYARKVRMAGGTGLVHEIDHYWKSRNEERLEDEAEHNMSGAHIRILIVFSLAMIVLPIGVKLYGWFISEIAALFLATALICGFLSHLSLNQIAEKFVQGSKDFISVAFIIALAKAIVVIASDGKIIDTILHYLSSQVRGAHPVIAAQLMFIVQSLINVFIPSGSGQAALIMPIMAPLGDLLHVTRQTAVLAFQLGDGLTNLIIPTSGVTMGVLGIAKIPYERWFRWMLPLQIIFFLTALLLLIPPVLMHWGPF